MAVELLGLFEAHLPVADLERAIAFYRDRVGLPLAHRVDERRAAFFWLPSPAGGMLGLWEAGAGPQHVTLHIAFRSSAPAVLNAAATLQAAGITPLGFNGEIVSEPVVLGWMPALSIYFHDPDGHLLEYVAMLPEPPRTSLQVVSWSEWRER